MTYPPSQQGRSRMESYGAKWSGHPNDPNAPLADDLCEDCRERPYTEECCYRHCDKGLCDMCQNTCGGCGDVFCDEHAMLALDAEGRCEECDGTE